MTIKPLLDKVVLKLDDAEETTASGIVLSTAAQEKPQFANVVAVGPGGVVDGNEVKMTIKVGDKVIASKYAGTDVKVDGEDYTIVRQSDILAIVE
ncbi:MULTISPECIES: co-chaperone GroES [Ruminococcus]|uniref:Co-chaperonin GroES n=1 Tax=Ruminococcus difficilis TaxID=2763069 RepID=A0A934WSM1_9FIRM|nr:MULTISPECIES: co-chaperone GroES [Ruminococcus]MBK6089184.1 co-chaperone GroES [Ruminococcus difficilis]MEE3492361.1 co-chaperone GroES [Ruminococcus sp.]